ncbi:hypothetical protein M0638_20495 [Roseomonas sp. NAR14]|uniref:Uncharacterized protein n=1 Tax=Roseomonas acroporae TaxID=2937791 RepID=A0A9X1YD12_9PROT|nr:hypothetical protein [Roseomonas acroporae]MCK8786755.1 hypothetical protein [Roseomonas acroporae]
MNAFKNPVVTAIACRAGMAAAVVRHLRRSIGPVPYERAVNIPTSISCGEFPDSNATPQRTGGRAGARMMRLDDLNAAGWRILPVPYYRELVVGCGPQFLSNPDWLVVPPDSSPEVARKFKGRGEAQAWATERCRAERQATGGAA